MAHQRETDAIPNSDCDSVSHGESHCFADLEYNNDTDCESNSVTDRQPNCVHNCESDSVTDRQPNCVYDGESDSVTNRLTDRSPHTISAPAGADANRRRSDENAEPRVKFV